MAITVAPLNVTTTALANGQIGKPYSSMLTASGRHAAALVVAQLGDASCGNFTEFVDRRHRGHTVRDCKRHTAHIHGLGQRQSYTEQIGEPDAEREPRRTISVVISPQAAGLTVTQTTPFSATTNDNAGVR